MDRIRVFVSYDLEHDEDLFDRMRGEAAGARALFEVSGRSRERAWDRPSDAARRGIRAADTVVFLCGEHTGDALAVGQEFRIVQEEEIPYLLVWGRRETMCTKPLGARPAEGMYAWTQEILRTQMELLLRNRRGPKHPARVPAAAAAAGEGERV